MKASTFDKLLQLIVSPILCGKFHFEFRKGVFFRRQDSGVRNIFFFDLLGGGKAFRATAGFNSDVIAAAVDPVDAGVFAVAYVTPGSLGPKPRPLPCNTEVVARGSLSALLPTIEDRLIPWFDSTTTNASLAELVEDEYVFVKGRLLASGGKVHAARTCFQTHLQRLERLPEHPSVVAGIRETRRLLDELPPS